MLNCLFRICVDMPLYLKACENDGQTQCTEQATSSLETMRTRYIASDYIKDTNLTSSQPTSLKPCNLSTCYNKFLQYYKLSTITNKTTIALFI
ncbi:13704_t:CDS:2 [Ambispora leptoticha]|uniref:13704_t:CDS:1 n=1 Tax=Ambispora leptoticha TaxID=144679 RepID=A0A9N9FYT2_9GLOM|nr:13704_t:CDS:2 [Ambispora leptoticha]